MDQSESVTKSKPKVTLYSIIFLLLASLSLTVFIIEVSAKLFPNMIPELIKIYFLDENVERWDLLTDDKELGFKYAPGLVDAPVPILMDEGGTSIYTISTVSLGYENIGFRDDGIDGEAFAVVVGDSFATCAAVKMEECWVEILERESGRDYANLGVISYGPQQSQRMLTNYGLPLEPKLVLWVFYANDAYDAWHFNQFGTAELREGKFWESPVRAWLVDHSATYMVLTYFWYNRDLFYKLTTADGETIPRDYTLVWWQTVTDLTNPTVVEGADLTQAAILEAKQQAVTRFKDLEFVVVIIPTREQIYGTYPILQSQLDALTDNLVSFAQQNDIRVINLTSPIRKKIKDEPFIYFKRDLHLNSRGNEIVAEILEQYLEEIQTQ